MNRDFYVLRRTRDGRQRFNADRLEVAGLIARGLIEADLQGGVLRITEAGLRELEWLERERRT